MRLLCAIALAGLVGLLALAAPSVSQAQLVREHDATSLRGFHGSAGTRIKRSFQSDAEARAVLRQILTAAGLSGVEDRITLRASAETPNAEAYMENNERMIFYNVVFMQDIARKTKEYWSMVAILAHEVGHHVRFHTAIPGRDHEFELEADLSAGFILRRMGATLEQSQVAFRELAPEGATATHPGRAQRVQMVTLGWLQGGSNQPSSLPAAGHVSEAAEAWGAVKDATSVATLEAYMARYKDTFYSELARARIEELKKQHVALAPVPIPTPPPSGRVPSIWDRVIPCWGVETLVADVRQCLKPKDAFTDCPSCPEMVVIPSGEIRLGGDLRGHPSQVTIAKPFATGKFEVTFAEWDACVAERGCLHKPDDHGWGRGKRPAINVSWLDITNEYIPWLGRKTGKTYRLLTDAEWEYAARANSQTKYPWGNDIGQGHANCDGCGSRWDNKQTAAVGSFQPNFFGLFDMYGNVWEWVADCDRSSLIGKSDCGTRILRGASWSFDTRFLRSDVRIFNPPGVRNANIGFRVARTLD